MTARIKRAEHLGRRQSPRTEAVGLIEPEAISRRAYQLFQERGRAPGRELDDWLRAEHELKGSKRPDPSE
jgi:hypothetical protein